MEEDEGDKRSGSVSVVFVNYVFFIFEKVLKFYLCLLSM